MTIKLTILGQPYSKSNSRRVATVGKKDNRRNIFIKSKEALAYEHSALKQIPPSARQRLSGPVRVTMRLYYASERPDLDESLVLDVLQDRYHTDKKTRVRVRVQDGVYQNDRQVRSKYIHHFIDKANPRAEIEVEELIPSSTVEMNLTTADLL